MSSEGRPRLLLAPQNIVTLGNLACGVGALVLTTHALLLDDPQKLYHAGWWLVLAAFLDAVDGKVARLTGTASPMGAQLDSLADAVTFGTAPGVLAATLVQVKGPEFDVHMHPRLLVVAPIVYACCAVLRLARFNLEQQGDDPNRPHHAFVGMPSPGAAGVPVAAVLLWFGVADTRVVQFAPATVAAIRESILVLLPFLILLTALLMVSRIPYPHFTAWMGRARGPVAPLAKIVLFVGLLTLEPELALAAFGLGYALVPLLANLPSAWRQLRDS
jgi:CDP-diacylglycerol--serine O-phosphatidyltransferase